MNEDSNKPEFAGRSSLRQVEIAKNSEALLEHYRSRFLSMYKEKPVIEEEDRAVAAWLVQNHQLSKCKSLVDLYLTHDDDWIRKQGYALRLLRKNFNALFTKNQQAEGPLYVVAFSWGGYPVVGRDPNWLDKKVFNAIPWETWVKQSMEEKYQVPLSKWIELGNPQAIEWPEIWKKEGWI